LGNGALLNSRFRELLCAGAGRRQAYSTVVPAGRFERRSMAAAGNAWDGTWDGGMGRMGLMRRLDVANRVPSLWLLLTMLLGLDWWIEPFWRRRKEFRIYFKGKEGVFAVCGIGFAYSTDIVCVARNQPRHHEKSRSHYQTVQAG
jgi:hypothetical protein